MKDDYRNFTDLNNTHWKKLHEYQLNRENGWDMAVIVDSIRDLEVFDQKNISSIVIYPYTNDFHQVVEEIRQEFHIRCTIFSDNEFSGYYAETHKFGKPKISIEEAMDREISFHQRPDGSLKIVNRTDHIKWSEILLATGVYRKIIFGYA